MQVQEINNSVYYGGSSAPLFADGEKNICNKSAMLSNSSVSFKKNGLNASKRFWMHFGNLSEYMKEPSEMVSAVIQAIGTSIVAPIAILSSPSRNVHNEEEKKAAKEKKVFQAYRQPFSALIALGFQVPATMAIAKTFDHFAYEKPLKFFADETIGDLIPNKKYLTKQAKKVMEKNADSKLLEEWKSELEYAKNTAKVKEDLKESIKNKYKKYGIELPDEKLEKMANEKKRITKFVAEKMASAKHDKLIDAKAEALKNKCFNIKDLDLVTAEDKNLAKQKFKDEFKALRKEKLNWFDNCIKTMGFGNGKTRAFDKAEDELAAKRGLELLKKDKPEIFNNFETKIKQFIKNRDENATKIYNNKKFWIQLCINLVMVGISCTVLNWMHPKFMEFLDGIKQAKKEDEARKVEVRA